MSATLPLPLDVTAKMKGLPFKAAPEDVQRFFGNLSLKPDSIFLKRHPDGRPSGEAFVRFESPEEQKQALQKDRDTFGLEKFGDRFVRVYPVLETDAVEMQQVLQQQTTAQVSHGHSHTDSVVKIKSLPFDASQLDVIQFFNGFRLKPNGVQLVVRSDNKPTGEAFVDFENSEEAARAIRDKDHKVFSEKFGERYVRLIQVSRKEMQATLALRFGGEGILKMKGIPFKATAADVRKFFSSFKIKAVSFIMHADGRPTGMAFIEFETPQEAVRAMEKDRAKFGPEYGDRFCMLQLVGRHEMDKVQLQREDDASSKQFLGGINVLHAAALAASQAALQNPALQPLLMASAASNPWLSSAALQHLGFAPSASAAALAAGAQLGQGMGSLAPALPALGSISSQSALSQSSSSSPLLDAQLAAQLSASLPSLDAATAAAAAVSSSSPLLYYHGNDLTPSLSSAALSSLNVQDWTRSDAARQVLASAAAAIAATKTSFNTCVPEGLDMQHLHQPFPYPYSQQESPFYHPFTSTTVPWHRQLTPGPGLLHSWSEQLAAVAAAAQRGFPILPTPSL
ncbi:hypothetical protein QJQ45_026353 [Haematococcus lacustris]|nr:hypothetical protein QJQ45_026353 [Haematococcus lacustris]